MATPTENVAIVGKGGFATPLELFSMFNSGAMTQASCALRFCYNSVAIGVVRSENYRSSIIYIDTPHTYHLRAFLDRHGSSSE